MTADVTERVRRRPRAAFLLLVLGTVATHTTMFLVRPLVSYRVLALGGSEDAVGLVAASAALLPIFLAISFGRLSDRGFAPFLLVGGGLAAIAGPLALSSSTSIWAMAAVNAVYGIALLALMVAGQAMVVSLSGPDDYDRNFGWFTSGASLGQMLGPILLGWVVPHGGQAALLDGTALGLWVAAAVAGAVALFYGGMGVLAHRSGASPRRSASSGDAGGGSALGLLRDRQLAVAILVSFAFISGVDLVIAYMPVLGQSRGLAPGFVGVLLAIRAASSFCSRLVMSLLTSRFGRLVIIAVCGVVAGLASIALVTTADRVLLCSIMVVLGLTLGLGQPLTMTWVVERSPAQMRATALALRITGNRLAQSAAPAGAGALAAAVGVAGPFALISGLMCVAACAVVPFLRQR